MKPISFPSTYISNPIARALIACFGPFIVYQPLAGIIPDEMCPWVDKGFLDVRVPLSENQTDLETIIKDYVGWAELHFDGSNLKSPLLQTWKDTIPYFSASSPSQVVADIKKQAHGKPAPSAPEPILAARLFLYFAQEFDRQNREVARDLKQHRQQEVELIRQLKMEDDSLAAEFQKEAVQAPDDFADYMVLDRLEAWTRIMLKDADISGLFITHIPAVFQELLDKTPTAEKLISFESIPTGTAMATESEPWWQNLVSNFAHIVEHKWQPVQRRPFDQPDFPAAANTVSLRVYLVPDQNPRNFFSRCAQIQPPVSDASNPGCRFKNTLIGLVEI